jgi:intracellular multiplication protein IcmE
MADEGKTYGVGGTSGRFRTFIIFVIGLVVVIGLMAYVYHRHQAQGGIESGASLAKPPSISSVPGEATTPEYARTVEQENIRQAEEAAKSGGSSISTIVRPSFAGGGEFESNDGSKPGCSTEDLKSARASGVKAEELKCRGCSAKDLRAAGYTAAELVAAGFSATELKTAGFTANELRAAGLSAAELRKAGFSANQLAQAGYSVCDLTRAGSRADELQAAGFTTEQMAEAGIGVKSGKDIPKDCNPQALARAKRSGIMASELRKLSCGAGALHSAGYTARELKAACYSAAELKAAGFSAAELKEAGFTAAELRSAGYTAKELKDAGFSAKELREAGYSAQQLHSAGFTPEELRKAGYTEGDLQRAGFTPAELAGADATAAAAAAAGLDNAALLAAKAALENPCSELSLQTAKKQGMTAEQLKRFKCSFAQLLNAGYSAVELQKAGYAVGAMGAMGSMGAIGTMGKSGKMGDSDAYERLLTPEQRRDLVERTTQAMETTAGTMFTGWVPPALQAYMAALPPKEKKGMEGDGRQSAGDGGEGAGGGAEGGAKKPKGTIIKAGTVMYASLETSINSDEKSPILASVVSGPLKGSRLIGEFELRGDVVVVTFNKINLPQLPASVAFKGVAIDPETARTALAHNVDNHYMLRYGSLFASSFVSGLATAVTSSGSQSSSGAGGLVVTHAPLDATQKLLAALGSVGSAYSSVMGNDFNTPPTVTIEGGAAIGVLLTDDLTLPEKI